MSRDSKQRKACSNLHEGAEMSILRFESLQEGQEKSENGIEDGNQLLTNTHRRGIFNTLISTRLE